MLSRETLERQQLWGYLAAILAGLGLGTAAPAMAPVLEAALWPALAALLYVTFAQVGVARLPAAFRDRRFAAAALLGNFVALPLLVWGLLPLAPADPAVRLGLLLVLLVPCTDWFITFAQRGGGDAARAVAITPVLLLVQMLLLPLYLWMFMGAEFVRIVSAGRMLAVFGLVFVLPLALAGATEAWAAGRPARVAAVERLGWFPVPLLGLVLVLIAASQVEAVAGALPLAAPVAAVCVAFLAGACLCGLLLAKLFGLPVAQARTLLFSLGTRNSFVVLPFALALPAAWQLAGIVIVLQSLVELFGMLALLWLVPRRLLPAR